MKKIVLKTDSIVNFFMLQLVVILFAFKDYSKISLISQVITFVVIIIDYVSSSKFKIKNENLKYLYYKIIFLLWCALSTIWAVKPNNAISIVMAMGLRILTGFTIICYVSSEERYHKLLKYMIFASSILCLRLLLVVPFSVWGNQRVGSYLAHDIDNSYGNTGITYILGFIVALIMSGQETLKNKKLTYLLAIIFTFFSLMSGSKKQILFLIVTIAIVTFYKSKNIKKLIKNVLCSAMVIVIFIYLIFNNSFLYNIIGKRAESFINYFVSGETETTDMSTLTRSYFLKEAWGVFKGNPIIGVGIDNFKYLNSYQLTWAENNFLELLADVGIIGFILYYLLYKDLVIDIMKRIKHRESIDIQILVLLVCFLIVDFTMVSYNNTTLQFYLAFLFATNNIAKNKKL